MLNIAILDDYQNAALTSTNWDSLLNTKVTVFNSYIEEEEAIVEALYGFEVVVLMHC